MNLLFMNCSGSSAYPRVMISLRKYMIGVIALIGATAAVPAQAAISPFNPVPAATQIASYVQYAQNMISPSRAKAIAAKRVRGAKFVDISRSGGKYRVRMLRRDGRVVDVFIDAYSGRVLN